MVKVIVVACGKKEKYVDSVQLYGELKKLNGVVIYKHCDEYLNLNIVYISVYFCMDLNFL